jgi:hypothetical protein
MFELVTYRLKRRTFQAVQITEENKEKAVAWLKGEGLMCEFRHAHRDKAGRSQPPGLYKIGDNGKRAMVVSLGGYLMKEEAGQIHSCREAVFGSIIKDALKAPLVSVS